MAAADHKSRMDADKKTLAEDREARQKAMAERDKSRGRPTPTQEEADLIKMGHHPDLAPDGSPSDPNVGFSSGHGHGGSKLYEDRQMKAASSPKEAPHSKA